MGKIIELLKEISKHNPNELDLNDSTMLRAISHLESNADALGKLKGTKQASTDFKTYIQPLLDCEKASKANIKSWRIVIDTAVEGGTYTKEPMIQICSGEPSYHRFIMKFDEDGVKCEVATACVEKEPDLSVITSKGTEDPKSLSEIKEFYDSAEIQRIAILGSARVFAHPDFIDPDAPQKGQVEPSETNVWAINYNTRVEKELNKFLDPSFRSNFLN